MLVNKPWQQILSMTNIKNNNNNNHNNFTSSIFFFLVCDHTHFRRLGVKSGGASVYHKTNRETMVEIGDSIRGKDIYIIQTGTK